MKEEPRGCSEHRYEKLNETTIYCPGCGDMRSAPGVFVLPTAYPAYPRCYQCGQTIYPNMPHYHYWTPPNWTTWSASTSGNLTISSGRNGGLTNIQGSTDLGQS